MSYKDMVRVQRDIKRKLAEQRVDDEKKSLKEAAGPESVREQGAEAVNAKTKNMPGKPAGPKHTGPETAKGTPGTAVKTRTRFMPGQAAQNKNKGPESVPEKKGGSPKVRVRFMPKGTKSASTAGPESIKEKTGDGVSTKTRFRPSIPAGTPKKGPESVKEKPGSKAKLESVRLLRESAKALAVGFRIAIECELGEGLNIKKAVQSFGDQLQDFSFSTQEGKERVEFTDRVSKTSEEAVRNAQHLIKNLAGVKLESVRSMKESFMEKEVYEGDAFEVETDNGTQVVPTDLVGNFDMTVGETVDKDADTSGKFASVIAGLDDYLESGSSAYSITLRHGWLARMQAPGYTDSTDWMIFDSEEEANAELDSVYGDDEPEEDDIFTESDDGEYSMVPCEAYGVKGMDSKRWRRTFKNYKALNDWAEKNDAEVWGTRDLESGETGYRESRRQRLIKKVESRRAKKESIEVGSKAAKMFLVDVSLSGDDWKEANRKLMSGDDRVAKVEKGFGPGDYTVLVYAETEEDAVRIVKEILNVGEAKTEAKKLIEAPEDEEDENEEPDTSTGSEEFEAGEEGAFVEPEGGTEAVPPASEEEDVPEGEETPSIDDQTSDVEAPEDSPREWNPGDTVLFDYGEGPLQMKIADGNDERPFRKEGRLWGDEKLPRTFYLVSWTVPETGETEEFYAASFLLK